MVTIANPKVLSGLDWQPQWQSRKLCALTCPSNQCGGTWKTRSSGGSCHPAQFPVAGLRPLVLLLLLPGSSHVKGARGGHGGLC